MLKYEVAAFFAGYGAKGLTFDSKIGSEEKRMKLEELLKWNLIP